MEIALEKLVTIVKEAFDRGVSSCADLKDQEVEELLHKFQIRNTDDIRIWRASELKEMPVGSIFHHLIRGRCWIAERANGSRFMQFDKGQPIEFNSDSDPWDKPMRLIYSEK